MKILTPGHKYELDNFEPGGEPQMIQFIEKCAVHHPQCESITEAWRLLPGICDCNPQFATIHNGTTNEECLAMLINRINFLNTKAPCRENSIVLTHLETALLWLNKRTADRKARGVEGTPKV